MSVRNFSLGWIRPIRYLGAAFAGAWIYLAIHLVKEQAVPYSCVSEAIADPTFGSALCGIMWPEAMVLKSIGAAILIGLMIAAGDRVRHEMVGEDRGEEINE